MNSYFDIVIDGERFKWDADNLESYVATFGPMLSGCPNKEAFINWARDNEVKFIIKNWVPNIKIVNVDEYLKIKDGTD